MFEPPRAKASDQQLEQVTFSRHNNVEFNTPEISNGKQSTGGHKYSGQAGLKLPKYVCLDKLHQFETGLMDEYFYSRMPKIGRNSSCLHERIRSRNSRYQSRLRKYNAQSPSVAMT